jgi:hypothetical protein
MLILDEDLQQTMRKINGFSHRLPLSPWTIVPLSMPSCAWLRRELRRDVSFCDSRS